MSELIRIKKMADSVTMPEYKSAGAAGFDLSASIEVIISAGATVKVPLGVAIALPEGYWGLLAARGSLHKKGLMAANGIGVMDNDYRGDADEYMCVLHNFSDTDALVTEGERIMQVIVLPYSQLPLVEALSLGSSRGGFGSTGTH